MCSGLRCWVSMQVNQSLSAGQLRTLEVESLPLISGSIEYTGRMMSSLVSKYTCIYVSHSHYIYCQLFVDSIGSISCKPQ